MSTHKKWFEELSEIESILNSMEDFDAKIVLDRFESIDEDYRDQNFSYLYLKLWKLAKASGRLTLANNYAKKSLDHLLLLKRVPKIKKLLEEFHQAGILKKKSFVYLRKCEILLGKKDDFHNKELKYFDLMDDHPEHWKEFPEFLKQYLLVVGEWNIKEWKLCYEYILNNHFDNEVLYALMEKAFESGEADLVFKFEKLFAAKKVRIRKLIASQTHEVSIAPEILHVDYDQVAMELLSGEKSPSDDEQRRVLNSLKFLSRDELRSKGRDMIVAFELLGMEKVVLTLCDQVIQHTEDIKERASIYYIRAQALSNSGDYFKVIDLIDELLANEPFYEEERMAFLYLKAEACLKVKKIKMAREIFGIIKKFNPHYRMVRERLKALETT